MTVRRFLLLIILAQLYVMTIEFEAFVSHYDALEKVTDYILNKCDIKKRP